MKLVIALQLLLTLLFLPWMSSADNTINVFIDRGGQVYTSDDPDGKISLPDGRVYQFETGDNQQSPESFKESSENPGEIEQDNNVAPESVATPCCVENGGMCNCRDGLVLCCDGTISSSCVCQTDQIK